MKARADHRPYTFRPVMLLVAAGMLLIVGALAAAYQYHSARVERRHQLITQANILAASVTAAIAFDDRAAAQEYVNALMLDPRLDAAAVYNEAHRQVAGFQRAGSEPIADSLAADARAPHQRQLVEVPARQGATTVGRVYLRAADTPLMVQLTRYSGVALLTIMAVLMLAVLAVAQGVLTRANEARRADLAAQVLAEHEAICAAIKARDPAAARTAAFLHMHNTGLRIEQAGKDFWTGDSRAAAQRVARAKLGGTATPKR